MKMLNWNQMSELGLIRRINEQVLHPLGLAMSRDPKTGTSDNVFVAPDGKFEYGNAPTVVLTDDQIKEKVNQIAY